ncbi:MarR family transcriptional regulator [Streptomyces sp. XM83C]|jgi:DNA-binding MarR family transcriptional regulator|uniref:MarR family winged helix-turn-helix transcriptional regulator n=1 Tax=Streptomyces thermocoprophilus TaxID=78356 RepID=A0ABV5VKX4_9ACTN|nr:MarR family transcriptional regulator [Streptomyces sp. XM83C]MCK1820692.1 MarR family transcriptional regulator [Streptomyces sp. XM83C]
MPTEPGTTAEDYSLLLEDQLCFALYAASRAVTARYRPLLDELGLTYPQYLVMLVLWEREPLSVGDIGAALQLESSTLSPLIKRLETAGLVVRRRSPDDERSVVVALTGKGREMRQQACAVPPVIGDAMGLTAEQRGTAMELLRTLTAGVARSE